MPAIVCDDALLRNDRASDTRVSRSLIMRTEGCQGEIRRVRGKCVSSSADVSGNDVFRKAKVQRHPSVRVLAETHASLKSNM